MLEDGTFVFQENHNLPYKYELVHKVVSKIRFSTGSLQVVHEIKWASRQNRGEITCVSTLSGKQQSSQAE